MNQTVFTVKCLKCNNELLSTDNLPFHVQLDKKDYPLKLYVRFYGLAPQGKNKVRENEFNWMEETFVFQEMRCFRTFEFHALLCKSCNDIVAFLTIWAKRTAGNYAEIDFHRPREQILMITEQKESLGEHDVSTDDKTEGLHCQEPPESESVYAPKLGNERNEESADSHGSIMYGSQQLDDEDMLVMSGENKKDV